MKLISAKKIQKNPSILEITYEYSVLFWDYTETKKVFKRNSYWEYLDGDDSFLNHLTHFNDNLNTLDIITELNETYLI
jgi:hypothetical protein